MSEKKGVGQKRPTKQKDQRPPERGPRPQARGSEVAERTSPSSDRYQKKETIAWIAGIYASKGASAAIDAFNDIIENQKLDNYDLVTKDTSKLSIRTDTEKSDGIKYISFGPPSLWESPYSILHVTFDNKQKDGFLFHSGEEILIPITGSIKYHFIVCKEGTISKEISDDLSLGEIVRINPQIPHHTWSSSQRVEESESESKAEAWMIFQHKESTASAIALDSKEYSEISKSKDIKIDWRKIDIASYAMIAWGISEKIRITRQKANLSIKDLASICGLQASYISRIEESKANISIKQLYNIARILHIDILALIPKDSWHIQIDQLSKPSNLTDFIDKKLFTKQSSTDHFIHTSHIFIQKDKAIEFNIDKKNESFSSYILLSGKSIFTISKEKNEDVDIIVTAGNVIHFRKNDRCKSIKAIDSTEIIKVNYSHFCTCI